MKKNLAKPINFITIIALIFGWLVTFVHIKSNLFLDVGNDMYYYLGLADSLLQNGYLADLTYNNPGPVVTPQNGLPLIIAFFKILKFSNYNILTILVVINYLLWCLSVVPFVKLIKFAGIKNIFSKSVLIFGYLAGFNILFYQLAPITDGIYNAGSIFLIWLLFQKLFDHQFSTRKNKLNNWWQIILLSIILVHFSFRIFIVLFSFLFTLFLYKKENKIKLMRPLIFTILTTFVSFGLPFLFLDTGGIISNGNTFFNNILANIAVLKNVVFGYLFLLEQVMFWATELTLFLKIFQYFLLVSFIIVFIIVFYMNNKKRNYLIMFSFILTILMFALTTTLPNQKIYQEAAPRYMIASLPLFYIMSAKYTYPRYFILFVIIFSLVFSSNFIINFKQNNYSFNLYLKNKEIVLPQNTILISEVPRQTYTWLAKGHNNNFCNLDITKKDNLYIAGGSKYRQEKLKEFLACHKIEIEETINFTEDYPFKDTFSLIEYKFSN